MCVTREQLFYDDQYSYNRFTPSRLGAGLAAMFPGLPSTDVADAAALSAALRDAFAHSGPSVVSVECSADEIPTFAPFLAAAPRASAPHDPNNDPNNDPTNEEMTDDVAARA
jgi:acetolactate synthase-1/2/3 large subunit